MNYIIKYLTATWDMTAELAPWLLLGFVLAGLVSIALPRSLVMRLLGKPGLGSIIRATIIGVPMPLCSCGVIPVAAAIRQKGASKGATASFLASTPELGVDSTVATWGMMGPLMTLVRFCMAFITGITAGLLVQFVTRNDPDSQLKAAPTDNSAPKTEIRKGVADALRYAFVTMPKEMAPSLIAGILLAGAISAFIPTDSLSSIGATGVLSYLLVTLIAIPLYVCSTGSIPLALAMMQAGFSPGSALVFLISGPATNAATITTMRHYLGTKAIVAYLFAIIACAWVAGIAVDAGLGKESIIAQLPMQMGGHGPWGNFFGVVLSLVVLRGLWSRLSKRTKGSSCCNSGTAHSTEASASCCCGTDANGEEVISKHNNNLKKGNDMGHHNCCCGGNDHHKHEEEKHECCGGHAHSENECECEKEGHKEGECCKDKAEPQNDKGGCGCH